MIETIFALYILCTATPNAMCEEGSRADSMAVCQEMAADYRNLSPAPLARATPH